MAYATKFLFFTLFSLFFKKSQFRYQHLAVRIAI
jgi:hypothetical protein